MIGRGLAGLVLAGVIGGGGGVALGDEVDRCASASEKGQVLRDQGELRGARSLFVACAAAECPAVVRKDCAGWLTAVEAALPSVVLRARDASGRDLVKVRVVVDGEAIAEVLDGRALAMDPGARTFRFRAPDAAELTQTVLLREGEKGRLVSVTFPGAGAATKDGTEPRGLGAVPAGAWALGGVSLVGFGALAGFGVAAKSAVDDMRATCAPGCAAARVEDARRDMILANVGLGVGIAALGAAALVVVLHQGSAGPRRATASGLFGAGASGWVSGRTSERASGSTLAIRLGVAGEGAGGGVAITGAW